MFNVYVFYWRTSERESAPEPQSGSAVYPTPYLRPGNTSSSFYRPASYPGNVVIISAFLPIELISFPPCSPVDTNSYRGSPYPATSDMNTTERVGWVSPQGGRSTWGILWSCFTVFLICSWKCTHLNLPSPVGSCAGWLH